MRPEGLSCTQYVHGCSGEFPQMMRNFPASARRMISFAGMCYNCLHSDTIACDYAFLLAGVVIALVASADIMLSFVLS